MTESARKIVDSIDDPLNNKKDTITMNVGPFELQEDLILKLSEDGHHLMAEFLAAENREPIKLEWFKQKFTEFGLDQLRVNHDAIRQCVTQYNDGKENSSISIAERLEGKFSINLSDDRMTATLNLTPAQGGLEVTRRMIDEELVSLKISVGIKQDVIDTSIKGSGVNNIVIATGEDPVDGVDGYFENLIPDAQDRRPRIDDRGIAHYNDISQFVTVKKGDKLVRRHLPTLGEAGTTVTGNSVEATPGQDLMFAANLPGAKISPDDPNLLLADLPGQPVVVDRGTIVEPTVTVENVDFNTGNIEFEGSVVVTENVTTGMQVKANGDITVNGMVEAAAVIEAGGNITVQNGIIGRGAMFEENGKLGKGIARLKSKGSISARFIENSHVIAGDSIKVGELVRHSDLSAKNQITVGAKNSKRGHIMGGTSRAEKGLQARVLGSPAAVNTKIEVGINQDYVKKLVQSNQIIEAKQKESKTLELTNKQVCTSQTVKPGSKQPADLERQKVSLTELEKLTAHNADLQKQVDELANAKVTVSGKVFNSVQVTIYNMQLKTNDEYGPGIFVIEEKKIIFKPQGV